MLYDTLYGLKQCFNPRFDASNFLPVLYLFLDRSFIDVESLYAEVQLCTLLPHFSHTSTMERNYLLKMLKAVVK